MKLINKSIFEIWYELCHKGCYSRHRFILSLSALFVFS